MADVGKGARTIYRICGTDVLVETSDPGDWSTNGMGRSCHLHNKISLRVGMAHDLEQATLLHEIIHMILDMNSIELPDNEVVVSVLANSLFAFMRDNNHSMPNHAREKGGE